MQPQIAVVVVFDFINRHHIYACFEEEILSLPNEGI